MQETWYIVTIWIRNRIPICSSQELKKHRGFINHRCINCFIFEIITLSSGKVLILA
ncbi:hypothetical protein HanIR_Chr05g0216641 [Helianthus annuus]|nr:hypothetical protein HanIR_Chr05g0216641 [Helianthus annuus]